MILFNINDLFTLSEVVTSIVIYIYQPLRSGRISHKVNF